MMKVSDYMSKIIITTDSTADISAEIAKKYNIRVAPLHVLYNDVLRNLEIHMSKIPYADDSVIDKLLYYLNGSVLRDTYRSHLYV